MLLPLFCLNMWINRVLIILLLINVISCNLVYDSNHGAKREGEICTQYNGSFGVCRRKNFCLEQQPTQKLWIACQWPIHSRTPTLLCCPDNIYEIKYIQSDPNVYSKEEVHYDTNINATGKVQSDQNSHTTEKIHCHENKMTTANVHSTQKSDELKKILSNASLTRVSKMGSYVSEGKVIKADDDELESDFLNCGICAFQSEFTEVKKNRESRIVNGNSCKLGQVPWMCSIYFRGDYLCGGAIVDERHIITAAHCFDQSVNPSEYHIEVGSIKLHNGTIHLIKRIIKHARYLPPQIYNDISLVELIDEIIFTSFISPICLPKSKMFGKNLINKTTFASGYGDLSFGGLTAKELQQVDLKIFNNKDCETNYRNLAVSRLRFPLGMKKPLICAGQENGGKDACQGDSGGPLYTSLSHGKKGIRFHLIGIVSFGYRCAVPRFPGVYTCVAHYLPWIHKYLDKPK